MFEEIFTSDMVHLNSGSPDLKAISQDRNQITVEWVNDSGEGRVNDFACGLVSYR